MHFHRRRILVGSIFTGTYGYCCYKSINSKNEIFRMGVAGSLANVSVEAGFHFIDTINVRAKVHHSNISMMSMVR